MEASNLGYQTWALAIYLLTTSLKGVSSMKLHRDLGISQKSAWHLAHRLRQAWAEHGGAPFQGPVEVDEAYIGGKEANKHEAQRSGKRGGATEKVAVIGMKDRASGQIRTEVIGQAYAPRLRHFVRQHAALGTGPTRRWTGSTGTRPCSTAPGRTSSRQTHTNGIESFWAMLKRGQHQWSAKHLGRYVDEFAGRYNARPLDTAEQMRAIVRGLVGKRLKYQTLTA